ncbi:MAG: HNH endonuclease [Acidobacteriaceae bacterium]|nr:HNH endonuclease [Acidobacteriaceae bacterium]MBV9297081.1 HNH endonuclease [Acidobacteriaceae bacterium]
MSELAAEVRKRARHRCEYCLLPQALFRRPFHIEHIIAKQHGGATDLDNLALACWQCNLKKGPNLSGIDPQTGLLVRLFHPRQDQWAEHLELQQSATALERIEIVGLTPVGRATVRLLDMNEELRQAIRFELSR